MAARQRRGDRLELGARGDSRLQDPLLRAPSPAGLCPCAVSGVPGCVTPGACPAPQVFLNQRQKFVGSSLCLPVEDSVLCHVLSHFCAVTRLGNLLQQRSSVPPCASWKGKIQIGLMHSDFHQRWEMINGVECAAELGIENL